MFPPLQLGFRIAEVAGAALRGQIVTFLGVRERGVARGRTSAAGVGWL